MFLDEQQQLQPIRVQAGWRLHVQLPGITCRSHRICRGDLEAGVMSLHMLPPEESCACGQRQDPWACTCNAIYSAFAHVTVLMLPAAAAAELQGWEQQQRCSQHQLQPLMVTWQLPWRPAAYCKASKLAAAYNSWCLMMRGQLQLAPQLVQSTTFSNTVIW